MPSVYLLLNVSAYAQQLEDMIAEKQEVLAALREKTRAFRYVRQSHSEIYVKNRKQDPEIL